MERIGGEDTGVPSSIRKVVVSSFIGTTLEWSDYFIYGTAAALVFPALFFPDVSELAGYRLIELPVLPKWSDYVERRSVVSTPPN